MLLLVGVVVVVVVVWLHFFHFGLVQFSVSVSISISVSVSVSFLGTRISGGSVCGHFIYFSLLFCLFLAPSKVLFIYFC